MTLRFKFRSVAALAIFGIAPGCGGASGEVTPRVRIETRAGDIEIALDAARAPGTVTNFLRYVDAGFYSGGR